MTGGKGAAAILSPMKDARGHRVGSSVDASLFHDLALRGDGTLHAGDPAARTPDEQRHDESQRAHGHQDQPDHVQVDARHGASTAKVSMAPTARRKMLTPIPIGCASTSGSRHAAPLGISYPIAPTIARVTPAGRDPAPRRLLTSRVAGH